MMKLKALIKRLVRNALRLLPSWLLPLDLLLRASQRLTAFIAKGLFILDWQLEVRGRPQFFKHPINLACWPFEPRDWCFTARGVYSRENMFRGCKVLDLCCGDGSYSYLFFSDIAGKIDSVDHNMDAINYGKRYFSSPVIIYHHQDIINNPFPSAGYDFIVWNAAICYFSESEIHQLLLKISAAGKAGAELSGMLPKANGHPDHRTEFDNVLKVERLLSPYFKRVKVSEINEGDVISFYFKCQISDCSLRI